MLLNQLSSLCCPNQASREAVYLIIGLLQGLLGGSHLVGLLAHLLLQRLIPAPGCHSLYMTLEY